MAYGGKHDVTKQVVLYVKKNRYMSNQELNRNIRRLFGCTYADSTYDRIKNGEYDRKFNINPKPLQRNQTSSYVDYDDWYETDESYLDETGDDVTYPYDEELFSDYNSSMQNNRSYHKTEHSGTSKKPSGANYFAAFCLGGLGIYGLFHGANPIHNFGGFVIALLLIGAGIACISGGK